MTPAVRPGNRCDCLCRRGGAREVSAADLEAGGEGLAGALGDGEGKWRLSVTSEQPVRAVSLLQSPTGHMTNLSTQPYEDGGPLHQVSMFPAASDPVREGFVRVANHSDESGEVKIFAWDDTGTHYGPVALAIGAGATVHFNSGDLEQGNPGKGLHSGIGPGDGDWWLEFESDLDLQVLGYVRTEDGFLTSMHDAFHRGDGGIHVPTFNPGSNKNQVSLLRLVNPGDRERQVAITGVDASGASPGSTVRLSVLPRGARTVTSLELESGEAPGLTGALGDGYGKWQLTVEPDGPLRVLSLLRSPTDHLTNLSTMSERFPSRRLLAGAASGDADDTESVQPDATTALAVKRAAVAVHTEPNVIVVDTETMGRIHFDLSTLSPDGRQTLEQTEGKLAEDAR